MNDKMNGKHSLKKAVELAVAGENGMKSYYKSIEAEEKAEAIKKYIEDIIDDE